MVGCCLAGIIAFVDPILNFPRDTNYSRSFGPGVKGALSPEELQARQAKELFPKVGAEECEVWTIGIILLCVALLVTEDVFYDFKANELETHTLVSGMQRVRDMYSQGFYDILSGCL